MSKTKKEAPAKEKPDVFEWAALNQTGKGLYTPASAKAAQAWRESKASASEETPSD